MHYIKESYKRTRFSLKEHGSVFADFDDGITVFQPGSKSIAMNFHLAAQLYVSLITQYYAYDTSHVFPAVARFFEAEDLSKQLRTLRDWGNTYIRNLPDHTPHPIPVINEVLTRSVFPDETQRITHAISLGEFFKKVLSDNITELKSQSRLGFVNNRVELLRQSLTNPNRAAIIADLTLIIEDWFGEAVADPFVHIGHGPGRTFDPALGNDAVWKTHMLRDLKSFDSIFFTEAFEQFRPTWLVSMAQYQAILSVEDIMERPEIFDLGPELSGYGKDIDPYVLASTLCLTDKYLNRDSFDVKSRVHSALQTSRISKLTTYTERADRDLTLGKVYRAYAPKDSGSVRGIGVQVAERIALQRGVAKGLREVVRQNPYLHSLMRFDDQTLQQRRAENASKTRAYSTIDLKDASNNIRLADIDTLFKNTPWGVFVLALADTMHYFFEDAYTSHPMYGGMGNGITFEFETILFAAIIHLATFGAGKKSLEVEEIHFSLDGELPFGSFGDDMVAKTVVIDRIKEIFAALGYVMNEKKSFIDSPFTESCGKWYFTKNNFTHEVTPIRYPRRGEIPLSKSFAESTRFVAHHNIALAKGFTDLADAYGELAKDYSPSEGLPLPTIRDNDSSKLYTTDSRAALSAYELTEDIHYQRWGYLDTVVSVKSQEWESRIVKGLGTSQTLLTRSVQTDDPSIELARWRQWEHDNKHRDKGPREWWMSDASTSGQRVKSSLIADFYLGLVSEFTATYGNPLGLPTSSSLQSVWTKLCASYQPGELATMHTQVGQYVQDRKDSWFGKAGGFASSISKTLGASGVGYHLPDFYLHQTVDSNSIPTGERLRLFPSSSFDDYLVYRDIVDDLLQDFSEGQGIVGYRNNVNQRCLRELALAADRKSVV